MYAIFLSAVQHNDITLIKSILDNRVNRKSWLDKLRYILYKNIDIHYNDDRAFYDACMYNSNDVIKYLLEIGEKTNSKINIHAGYYGAIKMLCNSGNIEMVKYLIEYCNKINDNFTNEMYSRIILLESCLSKNLELVKYIIEYCEKINNKIQLSYCIHSLHNCYYKQQCENYILDYLFYLIKHNYYIIDRRKYIDYKFVNKYTHRYITIKNIKYICIINDISIVYILNNTIYMHFYCINPYRYIDNYSIICNKKEHNNYSIILYIVSICII